MEALRHATGRLDEIENSFAVDKDLEQASVASGVAWPARAAAVIRKARRTATARRRGHVGRIETVVGPVVRTEATGQPPRWHCVPS